MEELEDIRLMDRDNYQKIKENDPRKISINGSGEYLFIRGLALWEWADLGRNIANNVHLKHVEFPHDALDDDKMTWLFRGLTKSSSIQNFEMYGNNRQVLTAAGVSSMVPFLENASCLQQLELGGALLRSEGFNIMVRALRDSPIEKLVFIGCSISSIEIDMNHFPKHLTKLNLQYNHITSSGCQELAKLLRDEDTSLKELDITDNNINDDGIAVLVDALRNNTSLERLYINDLSHNGQVMFLKLLNDISSIEATLQSNHTLICFSDDSVGPFTDDVINNYISVAVQVNYWGRKHGLEEAQRQKIIQTHLHCSRRADLAMFQGVDNCVFNEIDPLLMPEVLSLAGWHHGIGDVFAALKASIAGVIPLVNRKRSVMRQLVCSEVQLELAQKQVAFYLARTKELNAELTEIEAAERSDVEDDEDRPRRSKRIRL